MNPALIGYGVAFLVVVGLLTGLYFHGKHVDSLEGQIVTKTVVMDIGAKNADVLLNRPDFDALVDGVFNGGSY